MPSVTAPHAALGLQRVPDRQLLAATTRGQGDVAGLQGVAELVGVGRADALLLAEAQCRGDHLVLPVGGDDRPRIGLPQRILGQEAVDRQIEVAV